MTKTAQNVTTACAFLALGTYGLWSLQSISARATAFPRLVFLVMIALSLTLLVLALVERARRGVASPPEGQTSEETRKIAQIGTSTAQPSESPESADEVSATRRGELRRWLVAAAALLAYVFLFTRIGFYTATLLLTLLLPLGLGYRRVWRAAAMAIGFTGVLYVIFTLLLRRPLPPELLSVLIGSVSR